MRMAARGAQLWRNDAGRNYEDGQDRHEKPETLSIQSPSAKDVGTVSVNPVGVDTQNAATSRPHKIWSWLLSVYRRFPGVIASGAVAVVSGILAIVGVIGWGLPFIAAIVMVICIVLFRRLVTPSR